MLRTVYSALRTAHSAPFPASPLPLPSPVLGRGRAPCTHGRGEGVLLLPRVSASPLPPSSLLHSGIQQKNIGLSRCGPNSPPGQGIFPAFSSKTRIKPYSTAFSPSNVMDGRCQIGGSGFGRKSRSNPSHAGRCAKQIIGQTFRMASAQVLPYYPQLLPNSDYCLRTPGGRSGQPSPVRFSDRFSNNSRCFSRSGKIVASAFPSCDSAGSISLVWSSTLWSKIECFSFLPPPLLPSRVLGRGRAPCRAPCTHGRRRGEGSFQP